MYRARFEAVGKVTNPLACGVAAARLRRNHGTCRQGARNSSPLHSSTRRSRQMSELILITTDDCHFCERAHELAPRSPGSLPRGLGRLPRGRRSRRRRPPPPLPARADRRRAADRLRSLLREASAQGARARGSRVSDLLMAGSLAAAFAAGMVAFFAPCCAGVMMPAYLAAISGGSRMRIARLTAVYVLGVSVVVLPITLGRGCPVRLPDPVARADVRDRRADDDRRRRRAVARQRCCRSTCRSRR